MSADAFRWRPEDNLNPMDPKASAQVRAIDRADELTAKVWADAAEAAAVLFDPARVPELAVKADVAAAEFYTRSGECGDLHFDTNDNDWNPHASHEQGVVRVWPVGTNHVDVIRDRWRNNPNRDNRPVDYFSAMYGNRTPDYFDCARYGCTGDCDRACSVRLVKACAGPTRTMPVNRGTLRLLFRMCRGCEDWASKIAANSYKTAVVRAGADLPPGAVILPNPEPDVNPAAWA
ncbi:hypothetical protein MINTM020_47610 [Mycobacterium paraintracellulare]|uniref:hypothetical protein n=1 Tax=Mycobacterium avium complex (MAC) TaxID=120793 RepID=UPI001925B6D2|nr:hypothetical protein [Mycobacterium paraintracellulare]BCO43906.1 hypothetical protein MINTM001_50450 [Mycobacterium paraintracellulare]BCP12663.1 hypothetical protein MINTM020_47610 [Mycobacterium paraintracellulare]